MAVTIKVKSQHDAAVKARRELAAQRVLQTFGDDLPDLKLLAFFDDEDPFDLRQGLGPANRGFYGPVKSMRPWPARMAETIFVFDHESPQRRTKRVFDHGIYLYGSTCDDETALTMTFAHELQHFAQYGFKRRLWAVGRLLPRLPKEAIAALGLNWPDIPHEREARIFAKRVAVKICGSDAVQEYIHRRINEKVTPEDVEDWRFSLDLDPSLPYNLQSETKRVFQWLRPYRQAIEDVLRLVREEGEFDEEYEDMNLSLYFDAAD